MQATNLEQEVKSASVGMNANLKNYGIKKYLAIAAAGITLGLAGCDTDYEESKCCQELYCSLGECVDTTKYKDHCVAEGSKYLNNCCRCEEPEPNISAWDK
ncbi:MAG: hypothetical protein AABY26_02045 [Nanoarchaeota archaeon]